MSDFFAKILDHGLDAQFDCGGIKSAASTAYFVMLGVRSTNIRTLPASRIEELIGLVETLMPYQMANEVGTGSVRKKLEWEYELLEELYKRRSELQVSKTRKKG